MVSQRLAYSVDLNERRSPAPPPGGGGHGAKEIGPVSSTISDSTHAHNLFVRMSADDDWDACAKEVLFRGQSDINGAVTVRSGAGW